MAKVYDTPRYKDQCLEKCRLILSYSDKDAPQTILPIRVKKAMKATAFMRRFNLDFYGLSHIEDGDDVPIWMGDSAAYAFRNPVESGRWHAATLKSIADILISDLSYANFGCVLTDDVAMYELVLDVISGRLQFQQNVQFVKRNEKLVEDLAIDVVATALFANQNGIPSCVRTLQKLNTHSTVFKTDCSLVEFKKIASTLHSRGLSQSAKETLQAVMNGHKCSVLATFTDSDLGKSTWVYEGKRIEALVIKVMGLKFLVYANKLLILDHSATDQIRSCATFWFNITVYAANYFAVGSSIDYNMSNALQAVRTWIAKVRRGKYTLLPRHMKHTLALIENCVGDAVEKIDSGATTRHDALMLDYKEMQVSDESLFDCFAKNGVPASCAIDLTTLLHGLPAPDADARVMFNTVTQKLENSNPVDPAEWERFMKYCRAFDVVEVLRKYKGRNPFNNDTILDIGNGLNGDKEYFRVARASRWYRLTVSEMDGSKVRQRFMPPEEEWGRIWIEDFFPPMYHMNRWYEEAADVTHLTNDLDMYTSTVSDIPNHESNELLYAFKFAPFLSKNQLPAAVRTASACHVSDSIHIVSMAAKSENTKPASKTRETYSASDKLREMISEFDRTAIPLASINPAASLRMAPDELEKCFNAVAADHAAKSTHAVTMSLDVSGWSPNASRDRFLEHHDYVYRMTRYKNNERINIRDEFDRIKLVINKRGKALSKNSKSGMFQGFTGTMDTLLHSRLVYYAINVCKTQGLIEAGEGAVGMVLIDDAVIHLRFTPTRTEQSIEKSTADFCSNVIEIYRKLGLKIDIAKTVCSGMKFTYLNRLFVGGSEVGTPLKTVGKIDREYTAGIETSRRQVDSVFGSGRAALMKGACPVVAYYMCVHRAIELLILTCNDLKKCSLSKWIAAVFLPTNLAGFGFPSFAQFLTSEIIDKELHVVSMFEYLCRAFKGSSNHATYVSVLNMVNNVLQMPMSPVTSPLSLGTPSRLLLKTVSNPDSVIRRYVENKLKKYATSAIYQSAMNVVLGSSYSESLLKIIRSCKWDTSILEEFISLTPLHHYSKVCAQAVSSKLIFTLISAEKRSDFAAAIRIEDKRSLVETFNILKQADTHESFLDEVFDPRAAVFQAREQWLSDNSLVVVNHTLSDPLYVLAHDESLMNTTIKVSMPNVTLNHQYATTKLPCVFETTGNDFDLRLTTPHSFGTITCKTRSVLKTDAFHRAQTKLGSLAVRASAVNSAINSISSSAEVNVFSKLFCSSWGMPSDIGLESVVNVDTEHLSSSKRLGIRTTAGTHTVSVYRNASSYVDIDAAPLARFMDKAHINLDMLSVIFVLRHVILVEAALKSRGDFMYKYNLNVHQLASRENETLTIIDPESLNEALTECVALTPEEVTTTMKECITALNKSADGYGTGQTKASRSATVEEMAAEMGMDHSKDIILQHDDTPIVETAGRLHKVTMPHERVNPKGGIVQALSSWQSRHSFTTRRMQNFPHADVALVNQRFSAVRTYRYLLNMYGEETVSGFLTMAIAAFAFSRAHVEDDLICAKYNDIEEFYNKYFGEIGPSCVTDTLTTLNVTTDLSEYAWLIGSWPKDIKKTLMGKSYQVTDSPEEKKSLERKAALVMLLAFNGRLMKTDSYAAMIRAEPKMANVIYDFARRRQKAQSVELKQSGNLSKSSAHLVASSIYGLASSCSMGTAEADVLALIKYAVETGIQKEYKRNDIVVPVFKSSVLSHMDRIAQYRSFIQSTLRQIEHHDVIASTAENILRDFLTAQIPSTTGGRYSSAGLDKDEDEQPTITVDTTAMTIVDDASLADLVYTTDNPRDQASYSYEDKLKAQCYYLFDLEVTVEEISNGYKHRGKYEHVSMTSLEIHDALKDIANGMDVINACRGDVA